MAQRVLSLGAALVTAAGCVWYLPAFADLRARADRPYSRRSAAAACLTGWTTLAVVAVLLFSGVPWQATGVTAAAGATVTAALRIRAAVQHRQEAQETAQRWAALVPGRPQHSRSRVPSRYVVAALLGCGLVAATVTAAVVLSSASEGGHGWVLAVAPTTAVGLALAVAITYPGTVRRRIKNGPARPRQ
ncbi:membrane protein implicated in regulation of membrane protease activity [Streptomyces sp. SAI-117]|uniref:hypothetical protein n=1 Tax=Streptomyces sp. SAI-117 TaxID=2940546 RepID=UPI0024739B5F|nr:hypothetical protein [Streptomyces sp. SAI-117]MDH6565236.1 membrane protein implicated in regulation of membrane protease activity [Streptomyces sp. SAI-117]